MPGPLGGRSAADGGAGTQQHVRLISRSNDYCNSSMIVFRDDPPTLARCGRPRPVGQKTAGRGAFQVV
jgi:hypothetical protein